MPFVAYYTGTQTINYSNSTIARRSISEKLTSLVIFLLNPPQTSNVYVYIHCFFFLGGKGFP